MTASVTRHSVQLQVLETTENPKTSEPVVLSDHDSEHDEDKPSTHSKPNRKKKRMPTKSAEAALSKLSRGGKPSNLPDMPLDILFEIFSHLSPHDLLCLARATKSLRSILLSRSSAFVWKQARDNVPDLPECPPELSEPAYANLAFGTHCHFCGTQGAGIVEWSHFKRSCMSCYNREYTRCYNGNDLRNLFKELGITPDRALTEVDCLIEISRCAFMKQDLVPTLLEYAAIDDKAQKEEWKRAKKEAKLKRIDFHIQADDWAHKLKDQRRQEIKDLREKRSIAILDHLRTEGWGDVIDKFDRWEKNHYSDHKLVKQNKDLTDRIWKNIKPEIIQLFTTLRAHQYQRLMEEAVYRRLRGFSDALAHYCASLPFNTIIAPLNEILLMDVVRDLMLDKDPESAGPNSTFQDAFATASERSAEWRAEFDQYLLGLFAECGSGVDSTGSMLQLATSLFRCNACEECHLTYQQVLSHRCREWRPPLPQVKLLSPLAHYWLSVHGQFIIEKEDIVKCPHRGRMKLLLDACGLPADTTMTTVQEMNPLVECLDSTCKSRLAGFDRHAMYWHELISHCEPQSDKTRALSYKDLRGLVLLPQPQPIQSFESSPECPVYGCKLCCWPYPMSSIDLKDHLRLCHNIRNWTALSMEHHIIHPGASEDHLSYGVLYMKFLK